MCGIVGVVSLDSMPVEEAVIQRMVDTLLHRGPDGRGVWMDHTVGLGHARLSIIDVEGSKQPMTNEDGTVVVTFNGMIYNYHELRKSLIERGHVFRTEGDTEVLVHLYEEKGAGMVDSLLGMFAFGIWDAKRRRLLLVRDRLGIKPLYYGCQGSTFVFGSEPKAILKHPSFRMNPDVEGIWHYLTYRAVPAPGTLFQDIKKLGPGHLLELDCGGYAERPYWDIHLMTEAEKRNGFDCSDDHVLESGESLLLTSVKRRLISDVPLGAALSGGVDSSLIVALMTQCSNTRVRSYSVGFGDFPSSELPYARLVAEQYKTDHHEIVITEDCFQTSLEKLTWIRDSPLSEFADIPLYHLAKEARKDVKVLLSGEGSDELYGGYPKHYYDRFAALARMVPKPVLMACANRLPQRFRRLEVAIKSLSESDCSRRWAQWFAPFTSQEKEQIFGRRVCEHNPTDQYVDRTGIYSDLDQMLRVDCKLWLPENLLDRGDRMTMAASVECRVPFLDHEFVEFAFRLPSRFKVRGRTRKWLIRKIASRHLPETIANRQKAGFPVPLSAWFRGRLRNMCYDYICSSDSLAMELLDRSTLMGILSDHCIGRKDNTAKIWTLLGLSIWGKVFKAHADPT